MHQILREELMTRTLFKGLLNCFKVKSRQFFLTEILSLQCHSYFYTPSSTRQVYIKNNEMAQFFLEGSAGKNLMTESLFVITNIHHAYPPFTREPGKKHKWGNRKVALPLIENLYSLLVRILKVLHIFSRSWQQ